MTREEAIYRLKNMAWLYGSAEREQNIEAIDMAIEALQTELVQCKDCRFWKNEHLCLVMSRCESIYTKAEHYCSWGERREP